MAKQTAPKARTWYFTLSLESEGDAEAANQVDTNVRTPTVRALRQHRAEQEGSDNNCQGRGDRTFPACCAVQSHQATHHEQTNQGIEDHGSQQQTEWYQISRAQFE